MVQKLSWKVRERRVRWSRKHNPIIGGTHSSHRSDTFTGVRTLSTTIVVKTHSNESMVWTLYSHVIVGKGANPVQDRAGWPCGPGAPSQVCGPVLTSVTFNHIKLKGQNRGRMGVEPAHLHGY